MALYFQTKLIYVTCDAWCISNQTRRIQWFANNIFRSASTLNDHLFIVIILYAPIFVVEQ